MRQAYEKNNSMSEAEARALLERCMRVLFYRDARSFNRVRKNEKLWLGIMEIICRFGLKVIHLFFLIIAKPTNVSNIYFLIMNLFSCL